MEAGRKTEIQPARTLAEIEETRALFREYADSLGFDLSFQDFESELATLPGEYAPPGGQLLLARENEQLAGCVGVRPFAPGTCEMKRLYVRPAFRKCGLGRALAVAAVEAGRRIGYARMCLDTVPWMTEAIALYRSLGFVTIPPYRANPIAGAVFMELALARARP